MSHIDKYVTYIKAETQYEDKSALGNEQILVEARVIGRDPFARQDKIKQNAGKGQCDWCGAERALFSYGVHADGIHAKPAYDKRKFCSKSCRDAYYGIHEEVLLEDYQSENYWSNVKPGDVITHQNGKKYVFGLYNKKTGNVHVSSLISQKGKLVHHHWDNIMIHHSKFDFNPNWSKIKIPPTVKSRVSEETLEEMEGKPFGARPMGKIAQWFHKRKKEKEDAGQKIHDQEIVDEREKRRADAEFVHKQKIADMEQAARHKAELEAIQAKIAGPAAPVRPVIEPPKATPLVPHVPNKSRTRKIPGLTRPSQPSIPSPTPAAKTLAPPRKPITLSVPDPVDDDMEGQSDRLRKPRIGGYRGRALWQIMKDELVSTGILTKDPNNRGVVRDSQGNTYFPMGNPAAGRKYVVVVMRNKYGNSIVIHSYLELQRKAPWLFEGQANESIEYYGNLIAEAISTAEKERIMQTIEDAKTRRQRILNNRQQVKQDLDALPRGVLRNPKIRSIFSAIQMMKKGY